jgi:hypothetical protein
MEAPFQLCGNVIALVFLLYGSESDGGVVDTCNEPLSTSTYLVFDAGGHIYKLKLTSEACALV